MTKDLKDIKKLLEKPTFAQITMTEPPKNPPETLINKGKPNTMKEKTKKQQREKLTIIITTTTTSNIIKNQLKSIYIKNMIQKCQNIIIEYFKEK